jgi:hypothetical protein
MRVVAKPALLREIPQVADAGGGRLGRGSPGCEDSGADIDARLRSNAAVRSSVNLGLAGGTIFESSMPASSRPIAPTPSRAAAKLSGGGD